jgi:hypothetical protein
MAARLRNRMACQSWIGGGLLDPYGLSNGFCDSGFDYGYINQWNAQPQPAPGNEPQPMTTYDSSGAGCDQGTTLEEAPAAASNDTFYESSELDEVPESPDFEN